MERQMARLAHFRLEVMERVGHLFVCEDQPHDVPSVRKLRAALPPRSPIEHAREWAASGLHNSSQIQGA
jgi:hypothetical protein